MSGKVGPWTGRAEVGIAALVAPLTASLAPLMSFSLTRSLLAKAHLYAVEEEAVFSESLTPS